MNGVGAAFIGIIGGFLGLAALSVVLGSSNTSNDVQAVSTGLANVIGAAVAPVTGGGTSSLNSLSNLFSPNNSGIL
jgi:hypothetical protein